MRNEVTHTFQRFFSNVNGTNVQYLGCDEGINFFIDLYENGKYFSGDAPDMVFVKEENVLIIEHFEFDCYRVTRKGSTNRTEQVRIAREQKKLPATKEGSVFRDEINAICSYQDYIANVKRSFTEHYSQIPQYKKNLHERGVLLSQTEIKTMFLIEDVSPVGTIALDPQNGRILPVVLAQSMEFLEFLAGHSDVDYVLCCSTAGSNDYVWFVDCNHLQAYNEKAEEYSSMQLICKNPKMVGVNIIFEER